MSTHKARGILSETPPTQQPERPMSNVTAEDRQLVADALVQGNVPVTQCPPCTYTRFEDIRYLSGWEAVVQRRRKRGQRKAR